MTSAHTTLVQRPRRVEKSPPVVDRAASPRGPRWWKVRTRSAPYLFLLPYFLVTATFFVYPLVYATVLAFYQTNGPAHRAFVGLDNFRFILRDPDFHTALWNTSVFAFFSIFLQLPLSLGLALLLNARAGRMTGLFRLMLFSPNLVGPVFVAILFSMMFTPRYGLINRGLHA